jgi:transcriptional regulator with XRE-family HTH domain
MSTPVPTNADLGRALRGLRRSRRLTIEALALTAEMHPTYLSGIERGVRNPTWVKLSRLAQALDVPVSKIARDAEAEAQVADRLAAIRSELGVPS